MAGSGEIIPLSWLSNDCAILIFSPNSARISAGLPVVDVVVVVGGVVVVAVVAGEVVVVAVVVVVVVVVGGAVVVVLVVGGASAAHSGFLVSWL